MKNILCSYCNKDAKLVTGERIYPHRPDLSSKYFWLCVPCDAYVGCHDRNLKYGNDGTAPLGRLANRELRIAKKQAHYYFDKIWKNKYKPRKKAYQWLAAKMRISDDECHIGMFDVNQCRQVARLSRAFLDGV